MTREEFAELVGANVPALRVWESGTSLPRKKTTDRLIELAERNHYPLRRLHLRRSRVVDDEQEEA